MNSHFFSFKFQLLLSLPIFLLSGSCNQKSKDDYAALARREQYTEVIEVRTTPAVKGRFAIELISNGRLHTVNKAPCNS
jgi:hypothetical protein